jgi:hypothetical protein
MGSDAPGCWGVPPCLIKRQLGGLDDPDGVGLEANNLSNVLGTAVLDL